MPAISPAVSTVQSTPSTLISPGPPVLSPQISKPTSARSQHYKKSKVNYLLLFLKNLQNINLLILAFYHQMFFWITKISKIMDKKLNILVFVLTIGIYFNCNN